MHTINDERLSAVRPLLFAAILGCVATLSTYAAAGEIPAIYGPSNIGSLENGAVTIERDATQPSGSRSIEAMSPCATTFSGPSSFPWAGTYNNYSGSYAIVTAGASFPGCSYTATSDSSWIGVTSSSGPNVTYEVAANATSSPLIGHIHVLGAGAVFTLTITVFGGGAARHSNDFIGDSTGVLTVWRPSTATWYVKATGGATTITQQWGLLGDKPVLGDFDGDGVADFTVWRPSNGTWYTLPSSNVNTSTTRQFGLNGDIPVPADYDGDGKTDIAVFRPSNQTWYFLGSFDGLVHSQQLGLPTDIPVPFTNFYTGYLSVWRPSTGQFFVAQYGHATSAPSQLGLSGDIPLLIETGNAVWRSANGTWYIISGSNAIPWGLNGDVVPQAPHTAT